MLVGRNEGDLGTGGEERVVDKRFGERKGGESGKGGRKTE